MNERYMTIRELASTGVITEHALRLLVKQKRLPAVFVGCKAMLPYNECMRALSSLAQENLKAG